MTSNPAVQGQITQAKRTSLGTLTGGNTSLLLEKAKAGMRRSTPDSEALASSDDEQDQHHQFSSTMNPQMPQMPRGTRRSSWLSEAQRTSQRKGSLTGSGTFSPASSHPTTPATDSWPATVGPPSGSTIGRGQSNSASFPWGSAVWNSDSQKGPPSRLTEVLPSPTSLVPPISSTFYSDEPIASPSIRRDSMVESSIPFAIPLHPTPKTYRSQSYSVGQLDPESMNGPPNHAQHVHPGRSRPGSSYAGPQHRPSRPSMLGDFPHDNSILEQLREVDDDEEESSTSSEAGVQLSNTQSRTIEQLATENALLRQAAALNQAQGLTVQHSHHANHLSRDKLLQGRASGRGTQYRGLDNILDEFGRLSTGVDDQSLSQPFSRHDSTAKNFNEHDANLVGQISNAGLLENRKIESIKKGFWQSSLGFGGLTEVPQSRRHSFADVPTRHGSIGSVGDSQNGSNSVRDGSLLLADTRPFSGYNEGMLVSSHSDTGKYAHFLLNFSLEEQTLERDHLRAGYFAASYFSNVDPTLRHSEIYRPSKSPQSIPHGLAMQEQYARTQHPDHYAASRNQSLYIVTFKACRAEFYYVQEGMGLRIKTGDLVIVEADRGTDLGTVAHENIDWAAAKGLKEHYIGEHYRWLMMFSRHGQNGLNGNTNPNLSVPSSIGAQMGAIGSLGLPGQANPPESANVDIKPKMIKRLAQAHEIQTLRDKEGNEAKAKRMCQQKVVDHHLNMEILDAEFQMDWKKLTFYYFADSYINFNSLVTDLFKIYKTRIWMSAINPASFLTPMQPPMGAGQVNLIVDHEHFADNRVKKENVGFPNMTSSPIPHSTFDPTWNIGPASIPAPTIPNMYAQFYQPQGLQHVHANVQDFGHTNQQHARAQSPFNSQAYIAFNSAQQAIYSKQENKDGGSKNPYSKPMNDWRTSFQGLSLGS